jgi:hypothetical protein
MAGELLLGMIDLDHRESGMWHTPSDFQVYTRKTLTLGINNLMKSVEDTSWSLALESHMALIILILENEIKTYAGSEEKEWIIWIWEISEEEMPR